jgi:hypothetical protein
MLQSPVQIASPDPFLKSTVLLETRHTGVDSEGSGVVVGGEVVEDEDVGDGFVEDEDV